MKKIHSFLAFLLAVILVYSLVPLPEAYAAEEAAQDIRSSTTLTGTGYDSFSFLFDGNTTSYKKSSGNTELTLTNQAGIGSLYLLLHKQYGIYTVTDNATGAVLEAGTYGFLHEYIDLAATFGYAPTSVTIHFDRGAVQLSEIYAFSQGTPPEFVQIWEPSLDGGADLLLLATHGDDDQLFFAGLLPLYAGQRDLRVQVVYLTDHRSGHVDNARIHEMLNGLWAVGVEAYPVFGTFADFRIDSLKDTYATYQNSYATSKVDLLSFVVEQIRRFRPQVVVGHDIQGEYGHGMHMVYTDMLIQALDITADASQFPASAEAYGTWDVPKTYLHLYEENPIVLDYDQPLDAFDGLTAFQATQKLGYPCHKSQQYTWFTRWLNGNNGEITKATQIETHNPCLFGLYRSTVGPDVEKNDFLENIIPYAQQEQMDREAAAAVRDHIQQLGQITLSSGDAIAAARAAYEALTDTQKQLVENLALLQEAEAAYDTLVQEKQAQDAADAAAARAVMDQIQAIGTPLDGPSLVSIRHAYEALTPAQKELVTNYSDLVEAEQLLQQILAQEEAARLEQERLEQEQKKLTLWLIVLGILSVLLVVFLILLCSARTRQRRNKKR